MKSEFQITEEQTADLKRAEKEIEKELAEEIARLQSRARDKLLSRLKPGQAASIKEQIGDAFEFQAVDDEKKDRKPQLKKGLQRKGFSKGFLGHSSRWSIGSEPW